MVLSSRFDPNSSQRCGVATSKLSLDTIDLYFSTAVFYSGAGGLIHAIQLGLDSHIENSLGTCKDKSNKRIQLNRIEVKFILSMRKFTTQ